MSSLSPLSPLSSMMKVHRSSLLLTHESIMEARHRRRRRIQKQKQIQVLKVQSTATATNNTVSTSSPNFPVTSTRAKPSLRSRFPTTTITSISKTTPPIIVTTSNSFETVLDTGSSFVLVSDDEEEKNDDVVNKSTQSMVDKDIDSFILPLDYQSPTQMTSLSSILQYYCYDNNDDAFFRDDTDDPYLVPIASLQRQLSTRNQRVGEKEEIQQVAKATKDEMNKENFSSIKNRSQQQKQSKSESIFVKASNAMIDRRPLPFISFAAPVRVNGDRSFSAAFVEGDADDEGDDDNDIDSFITIQQLLEGTDLLLHAQQQQQLPSLSQLSEQFRQEQKQVQAQYQDQQQTLLLLSHMNGNTYLHQNHDIESAKLWYEYAHNQSNKNNDPNKKDTTSTDRSTVDPLNRHHPSIRRQHERNPSATASRSTLRKQPDNQLQQSMYRIHRLQRWYYEENPDVDENLLFEL